MTLLPHLLKFLIEGQTKRSVASLLGGLLASVGLIILLYGAYQWIKPLYGEVIAVGFCGIVLSVIGLIVMFLSMRSRSNGLLKKVETLLPHLNSSEIISALHGKKKEGVIAGIVLLFLFGVFLARGTKKGNLMQKK